MSIVVDHNPVQTEDGVWAPAFQGVEFLLAHVSCMAFQKKLSRLQQPYAKKIAKGNLDPEIQRDILCEAMSGTIVKGWRGSMVDSKGNPVPFDEKLCKLMLMQQFDVREFVTEFSSNMDEFRQEETQELGKS